MADNLMPGELSGVVSGNAPLKSLMDLMLSQAQQRSEQAPKPGERQAALEEYQRATRAQPDDRPDWKVMAQGFVTSPNLADPRANASSMFNYMLATETVRREQARKGAIEAAKMAYEDIKDRERTLLPGMGTGAMSEMLHATLNPIQNIGGVGISRITGEMIVPKPLEGTHAKIYDTALKHAVEQKMPSPEQYAKQQADNYIRQMLSNPSIAGSLYAQREGQTPLPSQGGIPKTAASAPEFSPEVDAEMAALKPDESGVVLTPGTDVQALISQLEKDEKQAVASGDYARAAEIQRAKVAIRNKQPAVPAKPTPLQYRDMPKAKMEESQAEAVGKDLQKEASTLNSAMTASNKMISQISLLEKLYSTPNMPEGELGPMLQQVRSGLKSLGVDVGKEVGAADMARAVASNFALHLRTGEGENLLPGAMSNYEDKLLQQMSPVLSLTNEGRLALARFMKEMAKTNARFGHEFNKMTDDRGIVSPEWRKRKERVMKEEMARIAEVNREIMKRFQGPQ